MLRGFTLALVCAPFALSFGLMAMNSKNYEPWVVAFFAYGVLAGLIVNSYASFEGENKSLKKGAGLLALSWAVALAVTAGYLIFTHQQLM